MTKVHLMKKYTIYQEKVPFIFKFKCTRENCDFSLNLNDESEFSET